MHTERSTWIEHYDKALRLWFSNPIVQHRVLTVFHVILPQVVLRTIAHKLDKVLYLSVASTLDSLSLSACATCHSSSSSMTSASGG